MVSYGNEHELLIEFNTSREEKERMIYQHDLKERMVSTSLEEHGYEWWFCNKNLVDYVNVSNEYPRQSMNLSFE
jgi:hypothetical protein